MLYPLVTLLLAPLLLVQGRQVRRDTPRLPEPAGPRAGESGDGPPLRLLVLGDSAAAGVGVAEQDQALLGRLSGELGSSFRLQWRLQATTGHRLADIIAALEQVPPEAFDVVVVSAGVNDATGGTARATWRRQLARLAGQLRGRHGARLVLLSALPPMQSFPALPQPLRWYMGWRARRFNATLAGFAAAEPGCHLAVPDFPLEPSYMAADGFHPGAAAYRHWAGHLAELIRRHPAIVREGVPHTSGTTFP